jgi:6-phosphogluconolactonase
MKYLGLFPSKTNPSYLAVHPNKKWLFSANETDEGSVSSYLIKDSSTIDLINTVHTNGKGPCYVSIDNSGKFLLTAQYQSGSVVSLPIDKDGRLGNISSSIQHTGSSIIKERQSGPHAHSMVPAQAANLIFSADLGTDIVYCYKLDTITGKLDSLSKTYIKPGSGPRHIAFHPNKKWMYLLNEISGMVEGYLINYESGTLKILQTIQVIRDINSGAHASDIHIGPSGKFLYAAERDPENTITVFSVNLNTGMLAMVEKVPSGGKVPRNFAIDPTGNFMIVGNQNSDNLTTFRIDNKTGKLTQIGMLVSVQSPACIKFMP